MPCRLRLSVIRFSYAGDGKFLSLFMPFFAGRLCGCFSFSVQPHLRPLFVHSFLFPSVLTDFFIFTFLNVFAFLINIFPYPKIYSTIPINLCLIVPKNPVSSSTISTVSSFCVWTYFICELSSFWSFNTLSA